MIFLKLVDMEYQVQTLAGHAVGTIRTQDYRVHGEAFYLKLHVMISKGKLYLTATQSLAKT